MAAVYIVAKPAYIKLHRDPPGDVIQTDGGRFELPPGRVLTARVAYVSGNLTIEAIGGPVTVNGVTFSAPDKMTLPVSEHHSITMKAA